MYDFPMPKRRLPNTAVDPTYLLSVCLHMQGLSLRMIRRSVTVILKSNAMQSR